VSSVLTAMGQHEAELEEEEAHAPIELGGASEPE